MIINSLVLSIPPYISTTWSNIVSLHSEIRNSNLILLVCLTNGLIIQIPNLDLKVVNEIFINHAAFIEQKNNPQKINKPNLQPNNGVESFTLPFRFSLSNLENFGNLLQHNSEQADSPNLPKEILNKIAGLTKTIGADAVSSFPKPEPHCNCFHCQIAKAIHATTDDDEQETAEEVVSDDDLKFKNWDIRQAADKLYIVTNPLDNQEQYHVYLGDPIGCTCGEKHCEHIRTVLNS